MSEHCLLNVTSFLLSGNKNYAAISCRLKDRVSNRSIDERIYFLRNRSHRMWGPPSLLLNGYKGYFLEIKRPRRELDHSHLALSFYSTGTTLLSLTPDNYVRSCDLPVLHACSDIVSFKMWTALLQVFVACGMQGIRFNATICPQFSISVTNNTNITTVPIF
jgi:hypothetical protein